MPHPCPRLAHIFESNNSFKRQVSSSHSGMSALRRCLGCDVDPQHMCYHNIITPHSPSIHQAIARLHASNRHLQRSPLTHPASSPAQVTRQYVSAVITHPAHTRPTYTLHCCKCAPCSHVHQAVISRGVYPNTVMVPMSRYCHGTAPMVLFIVPLPWCCHRTAAMVLSRHVP